MDVELLGDGAGLPVLGEEQPADLRLDLRRNGHGRSPRHRSSKSPRSAPPLRDPRSSTSTHRVRGPKPRSPVNCELDERAADSAYKTMAIATVIAGCMGLLTATERGRAADRRHRLNGRRHRARRCRWRGTLIRHARGSDELEPGAVGALVITVVEPPEITALVASSGGSQAPASSLVTAREPTVDLAAIARSAHVEHRTASPTGRLPKALVHRARASANAGR